MVRTKRIDSVFKVARNVVADPGVDSEEIAGLGPLDAIAEVDVADVTLSEKNRQCLNLVGDTATGNEVGQYMGNVQPECRASLPPQGMR